MGAGCACNCSFNATGWRPVNTLIRYIVVAINASSVGIEANVVRHCASARAVSSSLPRPASSRVRVIVSECN